MTVFETSWDRTVSAATLATVALLVILCVGISVAVICAPIPVAGRAAIIACMVAFLLLIVLPAYRLSPVGYSLTPTHVIIHRRRGEVSIPLSSISGVDTLDGTQVFGRAVRSSASGSLFGFFGTFSSEGMGGRDFESYSTRRTGQMVILRKIGGDPVVLSPDAADGFVKALNAALAEARATQL